MTGFLAPRHSNLIYQDEAFPIFQTSILASRSPWPMDPDMWDSATLQGHSAVLAPAVGSDGNEDIAQPVWRYIGTRGKEEHSPPGSSEDKRIALGQSTNPSSPLKSLLIASDETPASMALSGEAAASLSSTSCFMQVCDSFWPQEGCPQPKQTRSWTTAFLPAPMEYYTDTTVGSHRGATKAWTIS